jgi:hypothetical protein
MAPIRSIFLGRKAVLLGLFVLLGCSTVAENGRPNIPNWVTQIAEAVSDHQGPAVVSMLSGTTTGPVTLRPAKDYPWRPIFRGVDYTTTETSTPAPMRVHAIRVHLKEPGIEFLVTPSNGEQPLDTNGVWTSTFLKTYECQVAINASPFSPVVQKEQTPMDILGLSISRGDRYSPANTSYGALLIDRGNKAWIATPPTKPNDAYNAVGGFRLLLKNGQNVAANDVRHPRTAVGISRNGQLLYLVVIDGRQKGYSEGASTAETAEWMRSFGSQDALNLDGGGSTAMVISDGLDGAKILNRPIHSGIPGTERVVANHLGIFAKPLDTPATPGGRQTK